VPGAPALCLALDVADLDRARGWVRRCEPWVDTFKIGLELFAAHGPAALETLRAAGARRLFLDLKLHDIPNTVARAVRALKGVGVDLLTVHAAGGHHMVRAAVEEAAGSDLRVLAVTVLTSLDAEGLRLVLGQPLAVEPLVDRLGDAALVAGAAGLVCAPSDVGRLRRAHGGEPILATPGLRLEGGAGHDQRRVAHPVCAWRAGADLLVLGRAITENPDPEAALEGLRRTLS
jgi:orotidine-5'-phosphate decarboxylase